jgi:hypothetical protein
MTSLSKNSNLSAEEIQILEKEILELKGVRTVFHSVYDTQFQAMNNFLIQNALLTAHSDIFQIQKRKLKAELAKEVRT